MKYLITGGAGFVGGHLSEALLIKGHSVTVIDDLSTGSLENIKPLMKNPKFHFVIETILNTNIMDRLVSECDIVIHLAAAVGVDLIIKDPIQVMETNVNGTEVVLKTAARYRKKVMIASTSEVYGKGTIGDQKSFAETDDRLLGPTTKSRWIYACSKSLDEFLGLAYHKKYDLPVVIFRFFNTVGPRQTGQYGMVIPRFVKAALGGEPIRVFGDGTQSRCFCNVSDVVRAVILLSQNPKAVGEIFNIGSTEEISIMDLAKRVKKIAKSKSAIETIEYDKAYEPGFEDTQRRVPNTAKIYKFINWKPKKNLDQTLLEVVKYYKSKQSKES